VWEPGVPEPTELLRQGDLISGVPFPIFKVEPEIKDTWSQVKWKTYPGVVVSQCCTTQQRKVAEVAAVVRTAPLAVDHGMVVGLTSGWPAEAGAVFYDGMLLEQVGEVVPPVEGGRYPHAAFRTRVTFTDDLEWIQQRRVARMTAVARRNLRLRLGAWYARTEEQDAIELAAASEFQGFHDQPDEARGGF
jgi:hypothetical protein